MTGHNTMKWLILSIPALYLAVCGHSVWLIYKHSTEPLAGLLALFLSRPWSLIPGYLSPETFFANIVKVCIAFVLNAAIMFVVLTLLAKLLRIAIRRRPFGGKAQQ